MKQIDYVCAHGKTIRAVIDGYKCVVLVFTDASFCILGSDEDCAYVVDVPLDEAEIDSSDLIEWGIRTEDEVREINERNRRLANANANNADWFAITKRSGSANGIKKVSQVEFNLFLSLRALKPLYDQGMWTYRDDCGWIRASNTEREYWISE